MLVKSVEVPCKKHKPEAGRKATQVLAVPIRVVRRWGDLLGCCKDPPSDHGAAGVSASHQKQGYPPVSSIHPVIREQLRDRELVLGAFSCGLLFCGLLFFFGMDLPFQLLKSTI